MNIGGLSSLDGLLVEVSRGHAVPAVLGMARIGACMAWIPWLSPGVISSKLSRSIVALLVLMGLWPVTQGVALPESPFDMGVSLLQEGIIGTGIGLVLALPFHMAHGMGALIDNQRGAGVGAMLDPVSGVEATETANFFQLMSVVIYLATGGLIVLLEVLLASYQLAPMGQGVTLQLQPLLGFAGVLLAGALRMALPVLLLLFLLEVLLGVLSRYAQQMNAFSVSLAVKSLAAFVALLLYLMPTLLTEIPALRDRLDHMQIIASVLT